MSGTGSGVASAVNTNRAAEADREVAGDRWKAVSRRTRLEPHRMKSCRQVVRILGYACSFVAIALSSCGDTVQRESVVTVRNTGRKSVQFALSLMNESSPDGHVDREWPVRTLKAGESVDTNVGAPKDSNVGIRVIVGGSSQDCTA